MSDPVYPIDPNTGVPYTPAMYTQTTGQGGPPAPAGIGAPPSPGAIWVQPDDSGNGGGFWDTSGAYNGIAGPDGVPYNQWIANQRYGTGTYIPENNFTNAIGAGITGIAANAPYVGPLLAMMSRNAQQTGRPAGPPAGFGGGSGTAAGMGSLGALLPLLLAGGFSGNRPQQAAAPTPAPDLFAGQNQFSPSPFSTDPYSIAPIGPLLQTTLQRLAHG